MQLLAKFKKILYMEFRTTLNFRKFKVALVQGGQHINVAKNRLAILARVACEIDFARAPVPGCLLN